ncbi:MAG: Cof-type HAD-IIB family hydrolase [Lachnospiraceae bacterium]|nr:Cof-type HAD-IIB family hydrolase [Lachnospiraceae bacterium]
MERDFKKGVCGMDHCVKRGTYKAVFSDIDGTLLNTSHKIPERTRKKIKELQAEGVPFTLVSARMPKGMEEIRDELGAKSPMVCYSGALVVDEAKNSVYSTFLSSDMAKKVYHMVKEGGWEIVLNLYSNDHWYVEDLNDDWVKGEMEITGIEAEECSFRMAEVYEEVHKILCMGERDEIKALEEKLISEFPDIRIYRSKDTYLEIMSMQASKSNAIRILEEKFQISREETIAFGDSHNDIDMLDYVGLGVAMGNADSEVKDAADIITDSNDQEGLRKVLELAF